MMQEHKELLLRDLCARLPYNVIVDYDYNAHDLRKGNYVKHAKHGSKCILTCDLLDVFMSPRQNEKGEFIKPYLFPLSSMTDEQKREFYKFFDEGITESANETRQWLRTKRADETMRPITIAYVMVHELVIEWLNKNHFDYRGLIEKGLAIDATNLNVYYERDGKGRSM